MPRHRSLTLRKFVESIHSTLMERYFTEMLPEDVNLPAHIIMNTEAVERFMEAPQNAEAKSLVEQDFRRINDICEKGKNHIVSAYKFCGIIRDDKLTLPGMAMKLFIDYPEAFDYAYAWYSYYNTDGKMSHHKIPGEFDLTDKKVELFLQETKEWFKDLAKGSECLITHYDEDDSSVILIKHGSYVRTIAYWKNDMIKLRSFRPASEDLLMYNKKSNILSVKASLPKDREQYIKSFSRCIMGDETLADSAGRDRIYSLKPFQNGSFNWGGNEHIKEILLTSVKIKLPGASEPVIKISSKDIRRTLEKDLPNIDLNTGEMTHANFRFILDVDGKQKKVSFKITPPDVSNLSQKKHAEIISSFLNEQGVKLV